MWAHDKQEAGLLSPESGMRKNAARSRDKSDRCVYVM